MSSTVAPSVSHPAATEPPAGDLPRPLLLSFAMLLLMLVLAALDGTIVATALPSIAADLQGASRLSWVVSAYLIASTVAVPLYGRLADLHGSKPVLLWAVVLFLAGSLLCGISRTMDQLILARGLQGAGGGGLLTLATTAVVRVYPPASRARLQGLLGAVYGLSTMAGPLVGGFMVEHLSWRWAFFVNLPFGLLAAVLLVMNFPRQSPTERGSMDLLGALLLTASLVCLLLGTRRDEASAAALPAALFLGLGALLALAFVAWQGRAASPLLPLSLFRHRAFSAATALSAGSGVALFAGVVFMPQYFQSARGLSPASSGWHLMPLMAGITVGSTLCGRVLTASGRVRGVALAACAAVGLSFLLLGMLVRGPGSALVGVAAALLPLGIGIGATFPLITVVAQSSAPMALMGIATASPVMFRSVAAAVGLSALAALFEHGLAGGTRAGLFGDALAGVFWAAAAVSLVSAWAAWNLPPRLVKPAGSARTSAR